jgi:hypothetical protein
MKLVQQIKNKLDANMAIIMKADKSSALVIAFQQDCDRKAEVFINSDNFSNLYFTALIPRSNKWKLTDLN